MPSRSLVVAEFFGGVSHVPPLRLDHTVVLSATSSHRGRFVEEMLASIHDLQRHHRLFTRVTLRCNHVADWAAGHSRALVARSLLPLLPPHGGTLVLEAPADAPAVHAQLVSLGGSLSELYGAHEIAIVTQDRLPTLRPGLAFAGTSSEGRHVIAASRPS